MTFSELIILVVVMTGTALSIIEGFILINRIVRRRQRKEMIKSIEDAYNANKLTTTEYFMMTDILRYTNFPLMLVRGYFDDAISEKEELAKITNTLMKRGMG